MDSARVVADAAGAVKEESDFLPYGEERVITDTLDNTYKFTGHERDTDAERVQDHTLYRQYTPLLARWHCPDPLRGSPANPQSWSRYSYTAGNPINAIDPNGAVTIFLDVYQNYDCMGGQVGYEPPVYGELIQLEGGGCITLTSTGFYVNPNCNSEIYDSDPSTYTAAFSFQSIAIAAEACAFEPGCMERVLGPIGLSSSLLGEAVQTIGEARRQSRRRPESFGAFMACLAPVLLDEELGIGRNNPPGSEIGDRAIAAVASIVMIAAGSPPVATVGAIYQASIIAAAVRRCYEDVYGEDQEE